jgi:hypothetical protein
LVVVVVVVAVVVVVVPATPNPEMVHIFACALKLQTIVNAFTGALSVCT